jgi:hypothetical protein
VGAESIPLRHFEIAGLDEDVFGLLANLNESFGDAAKLFSRRANVHVDFHTNLQFNDLRCLPGHESAPKQEEGNQSSGNVPAPWSGLPNARLGAPSSLPSYVAMCCRFPTKLAFSVVRRGY